MKKILLILLIFIFMAFPAYAQSNVDYNVEGNNAQITINDEPNSPVSIIIKDNNRKYYIDQGTTDKSGYITFKAILQADKSYDCEISINGEMISSTITIEESGHSSPATEDKAKLSIKGYSKTILSKAEVKIKSDDTIYSLTVRTLKFKNIDYKSENGYFASIGGDKEHGHGSGSGWLYKLNGDVIGKGADDVEVEDGDKIEWAYTTDYGKDIGNNWSNNSSSNNDLEDKVRKALSNKENEIHLNYKETDKNETIVSLSSDLKKKVFDKGIDKVVIDAEIAQLDIASNTFKEDISDKKIDIQVKKMENLSSAIVPKDSIVVDINMYLDDKKISEFNKPINITIPYLGDSEDRDSITVFLLKDDGTIEPMGGIYDSKSKTIKFATNHLSQYFAKTASEQFYDMNEYLWAKESVEIMAGKGFINGRSEGCFDPSAEITRAEFVSITNRMLKYKATNSLQMNFKDVNNQSWYYDDVVAAFENGLIIGKDGNAFDPQGKITRQEAVKIIGKVLNNNSYTIDNLDGDIFNDQNQIALWAQESVNLCTELEIINGMGNGNFKPNSNTNRAQSAIMLFRMYKVIMQ